MIPRPADRETPPHLVALGASPAPLAAGADDGKARLAIHDHELVRQIGQGAYGEVWLARSALGTARAIKVVYRKDFEDGRPFEREFAGIQKFEPISRSHPGLVNILQVGRREGYFYYVMELADTVEAPKDQGQNPNAEIPTVNGEIRISDLYLPRTLREDLRRQGRLPAQRCVEIGVALAFALAHLHRHGLVHRDVKPSNIIFVQGAPKLADIGLVTEAGDSRSIVGTEGYLPPEGPGTPQADIFSLGKVLYEISTGQNRRQFPDLPSDIKKWPDARLVFELNHTVLRACAADARQRYQSADEMRADLILSERGQSVRRRHVWQQRIRILRRIALAGAAMVITAAGGIFLWTTAERGGPPSLSREIQDIAAGTGSAKAAEAYQLGLPGLRRGTPEGFRQALVNFTAATEADPQFVAAYARLFEIYLMSEDHGLAIIDGKRDKLNQLSARLGAIAPTHAETHAALAIVRFLDYWKWGEAEDEFKQALRLDPNSRMALTYYGYFLTRQGRASEARQILEQARKLDPTSPLIRKFLGHCEFVQRHYEKALRFYLEASDTEPSYPSGHYWAGRAYVAMTNYDQALTEFKEFELRQGRSQWEIERLYQRYRKALEKDGFRGYWTERMTASHDDPYLRTPYTAAEQYARLGNRERALGSLEEALRQRDSMEHLLVDEFWDDYRSDPSFRAIVDKVGLIARKH